MFDERLVFSFTLRGVVMTAAIINVRLAFGDYRTYRDVRGLRGFVAALTMLFGAVALAASSDVLRDTWPGIVGLLRIVTSAGIIGFLVGLFFSVYTWRRGR